MKRPSSREFTSFLKRLGAKQRKMQRDYKFYNIPKKCSIQDYEHVTEGVIKKYSRLKDLISVYNWGSPSVNGISDIDLLLIFDYRTAHALPFFRRSFNFLNSKARYLIRHPFIFIDETSFKNVKYVYPNADFKLLYGKEINMNPLSFQDIHYSKIALLNDIIIRHYPRDFLEQAVNKRINVRDTLLRLNSLKYSIEIIQELTKSENKQWGRKIKLVQELREGWFENNDFGLLALLAEDSIKIAMEIIENFQLFLMKNDLVKINSAENIKYNGIKNKTDFIKNWDRDKSLRDMSEVIKNKKRAYSILPVECSAQLIEYSKYSGRISDYIKNNISRNIHYQLKYKKTVEQRAMILNKQAELAFKLRHSDFAAFFDFGYRNKSGINNSVLNFLDKVRF